MARARPTSVTVLGVLNLLFACCGCFGLAGTAVLVAAPDLLGKEDLAVGALRDSAAYSTWMKASIPLTVISVGAQVASGIGLLMVKSWGRRLAIGWAVFAVVWYLPAISARAEQMDNAAARGGALGGAVGGLAGGFCMGLAYPVVLLWLLARPNVVAAFAQQGEGELPPRSAD